MLATLSHRSRFGDVFIAGDRLNTQLEPSALRVGGWCDVVLAQKHKKWCAKRPRRVAYHLLLQRKWLTHSGHETNRNQALSQSDPVNHWLILLIVPLSRTHLVNHFLETRGKLETHTCSPAQPALPHPTTYSCKGPYPMETLLRKACWAISSASLRPVATRHVIILPISVETYHNTEACYYRG